MPEQSPVTDRPPTPERVSDEILERLRPYPSNLVFDILNHSFGYSNVFLEGVKSFTPGAKLVGRAVTVRFLPQRPDLKEEKQGNEFTPEYRAMELCGPGDVLVMDAMKMPYASVGGEIKLMRLHTRKAEGLVTDGGLRDCAALNALGLKLFAQTMTVKAGPLDMFPYEENVAIQCAGVLVRPGDLLLGDEEGVVVIPKHLAQEVLDKAVKKTSLEDFIRERILTEDVSPGKYYPPRESTQKAFREWKEKQKG